MFKGEERYTVRKAVRPKMLPPAMANVEVEVGGGVVAEFKFESMSEAEVELGCVVPENPCILSSESLILSKISIVDNE